MSYPDPSPRLGDTDNVLLFKIAQILNSGGGGAGVVSFNTRTGAITLVSGDVTGALGFTPAVAGSGVTSFNTRTGAVTLILSDVSSVADSRYVLKAGDTMTGGLVINKAAVGSSWFSAQLSGVAFTEIASPGAAYSGSENTWFGIGAGKDLTSGFQNTLYGYHAGFLMTTGTENVCFGRDAGASLTSGPLNTCLGNSAGGNLTTPSANTFIGQKAGVNCVTGGSNTAVGKSCAASGTGSNNSSFGTSAGEFMTSGNENVFFGSQAGIYSTGSGNTFVGRGAGAGTLANNNTASNNVFVGFSAGSVNRSGNQNVTVGYQAGVAITTGAANVLIGYQAGTSLVGAIGSIHIGSQAGFTTTGGGNIFIGVNAGQNAGATTNQFVSGSDNASYSMNEVYFGKGIASATPTNYTINGTGGTGTDIVGGNLSLAGGKSTGNAVPAKVVVRGAVPGASGATAQTLVNRILVNGRATLASGSAVTLTTLTCAALQAAGGHLIYSIEAIDATDIISSSGQVAFSLVNKAGTFTGVTSVLGTEALALSDGTDTLVNTFAFAAGTGNLQITSTVTGMTPTTFRIIFAVVANSSQETV